MPPWCNSIKKSSDLIGSHWIPLDPIQSNWMGWMGWMGFDVSCQSEATRPSSATNFHHFVFFFCWYISDYIQFFFLHFLLLPKFVFFFSLLLIIEEPLSPGLSLSLSQLTHWQLHINIFAQLSFNFINTIWFIQLNWLASFALHRNRVRSLQLSEMITNLWVIVSESCHKGVLKVSEASKYPKWSSNDHQSLSNRVRIVS